MRQVLAVAVSSLVLPCGYEPSACTCGVTVTTSAGRDAFHARGCATVTGRAAHGFTVNLRELLTRGPGREPRRNSGSFGPSAEGHGACALAGRPP